METIVVAASLVAFSIIGFIASFQGLDLRKWSSWLYGALAFVFGFAMGSAISNGIEGLKTGFLFAFLTLFTGATMRWHKQRFQGRARSLVLRYDKAGESSLLAKLVRKLLGKDGSSRIK